MKKEIINERSKDRLKKEISKRMRTSMIGAVSSIEKILGHLWCHECVSRTPEQEKLYLLFQELRTEILDKGNDQIRSCESELSSYEVVWQGYHINLPIRPLGGN